MTSGTGARFFTGAGSFGALNPAASRIARLSSSSSSSSESSSAASAAAEAGSDLIDCTLGESASATPTFVTVLAGLELAVSSFHVIFVPAISGVYHIDCVASNACAPTSSRGRHRPSLSISTREALCKPLSRMISTHRFKKLSIRKSDGPPFLPHSGQDHFRLTVLSRKKLCASKVCKPTHPDNRAGCSHTCPLMGHRSDTTAMSSMMISSSVLESPKHLSACFSATVSDDARGMHAATSSNERLRTMRRAIMNAPRLSLWNILKWLEPLRNRDAGMRTAGSLVDLVTLLTVERFTTDKVWSFAVR